MVPAASDIDDLPSKSGRPRSTDRGARLALAVAEESDGEGSDGAINDVIISTTKYAKITKKKISKFFMPSVFFAV